MRAIPAFACVLFAVAVGTASDGLAQPRPKAFVCSFIGGFVAAWMSDWQAGAIDESLEFTFAAFDSANSKAQILAQDNATDVFMTWGEQAVTFVESTRAGELTITTVFLAKEKGGRFPAIHSRHMLPSGDPVVSQLRGSCEAKH